MRRTWELGSPIGAILRWACAAASAGSISVVVNSSRAFVGCCGADAGRPLKLESWQDSFQVASSLFSQCHPQ